MAGKGLRTPRRDTSSLLDRYLHFLAQDIEDPHALEAWVGAYPRSSIPGAIQGAVLNRQAWKARGGNFAISTTSHQVAGFQGLLELARTRLEKSLPLSPRTPFIPALLVGVGRGLSDGRLVGSAFQEAMERDPGNLVAAQNMLTALLPKWGGEPGQALAFAKGLPERYPDSPWLHLLLVEAHLEEAQRRPRTQREAARWFGQDRVRADLAPALDAFWSETGGSHDFLHAVTKAADRIGATAEALHWMRRRAETGDPGVQGHLVERLLGLPPGADRHTEARRWAEAGARKGDLLCLVLLGRMLRYGLGGGEDLPAARTWLRKAAQAKPGSWEAATDLGELLRDGSGGERDDAEAVQWFRVAAEAGYPRGQFELGMMLGEGRGVAKDSTASARWIVQAANGGYGPGVLMAARMLERGIGLRKDTAESKRLYERLGGRDFVTAALGLGRLLLKAREDPFREPKARRWLELAARRGNPYAKAEVEKLQDARTSRPAVTGEEAAVRDAEELGDFRELAELAGRHPEGSPRWLELATLACDHGAPGTCYRLAMARKESAPKAARAAARSGANLGHPACLRFLEENPGSFVVPPAADFPPEIRPLITHFHQTVGSGNPRVFGTLAGDLLFADREFRYGALIRDLLAEGARVGDLDGYWTVGHAFARGQTRDGHVRMDVARFYLETGAALGSERCMEAMAFTYMRKDKQYAGVPGWGAKEDLPRAIHWFTLAKEAGSDVAAFILDKLR